MSPEPSIALDYTLYDLYSIDNEQSNVVLLYNPFIADEYDASTRSKFTYQYTLQQKDETAESLQIFIAKLTSQRNGFSVGNMPLIIRDLNPQSDGDAHSDYADVFQNFAQLPKFQRPDVKFARDMNSVSLNTGMHIAAMFPSDGLLHLPHVIDPSVHFELLSKRGLALSGLPTPASEVLDTTLSPSEAQMPSLRNREVARMINKVEQHPLPFVIKLQQTISGIGVFKIFNQADWAQAKEILSSHLGDLLYQISPLNKDTHPCSLVVQEYISGPVRGLSMFITKTGRPIFIACCEQRFDEHNTWAGGTISYKQQKHLEKSHSSIMTKVANFLHGKGYYGPAGIDVIADQKGNHYIVDLNVRITGTYHLGPLCGHFARRGIFEAALFISPFLCARRTFEEAFANEIQAGTIIVTGWVHDKVTGRSYGAVNVGGTDTLVMEQLLKKVKEFAFGA